MVRAAGKDIVAHMVTRYSRKASQNLEVDDQSHIKTFLSGNLRLSRAHADPNWTEIVTRFW